MQRFYCRQENEEFCTAVNNFTTAPPWRLSPNWKTLPMNNNLGTRLSLLESESAKRVSPHMKEVIQSAESTKETAKDQGKLLRECLHISLFVQFCRVKELHQSDK